MIEHLTEYQAYAVWSVVASSVIFALVIVFVFSKYLAPAIAAAQQARNEQIAAAERERDRALAELQALRGEQLQLDESLAQMRLRAQSEAKSERERIIHEAQTEGDRLIRNAEGELDRSRAAAKSDFQAELLSKAIVRARERAAREIDEQRDARIIGAFAQSLHKSDGNSYAVAGEAQHG